MTTYHLNPQENGRYFRKWEIFWKIEDILEDGRYFGKLKIFWKMEDILENLRYFGKWEIFWRIEDILRVADIFYEENSLQEQKFSFTTGSVFCSKQQGS